MKSKTSLMMMILLASISVCQAASATDSPRKFDEYGAAQCEDEMARLDNYVTEAQNFPEAKAVIIVYGGRRDTRRNQVKARLSRIRHYLINIRGLDANCLILFDGGFRKQFTVELWLIPQGSEAKVLIAPTVESKNVRYKKGRVEKWEYDCSVLG